VSVFFVRLALALLLACGFCAASATDDDASKHASQEAGAKQKLDQVRGEIKKISDTLKTTQTQRDETTRAVREQELKIAAAAKELRELDAKILAQSSELGKLEIQRGALNEKLKAQRDALAALLRSAYALGQNEELKLLLAQDDIDKLARVLAYHHYFERARVEKIEGLLKDLQQLADVQTAIEKQTEVLKVSRTARADDAAKLQQDRSEREKLLAELDATLKDEQSRLNALGKDEKGVLDLLDKLRDIFADIPKQLAGAEPFAELKGKLVWPVRGKIGAAFGANDDSGRGSHGIVIAATTGAEVHAISHGRIAYADWLRGFGLLLIVDHGDGYLSLYGYNESLLKDVGDWVNANEVIATAGNSGGRKTPGVYFELRYQGKPMDPRGWLSAAAH